MNYHIKRTRKSLIAGTLDIIIGILTLIVLSIFAISPLIITPVQEGIIPYDLSLSFIIIPAIIIASLAIIGGVFAIQRKNWKWALAGSIAAAINPIPLGIGAIILLALSRNEFS